MHPLNQDETYDVEDLRRFAAEEGLWRWEKPDWTILHAGNKGAPAGIFIHHIQIGRELQKPVIVHTAMREPIRCLFCAKKK